jgi:hypothetical protein
MHKEETEVIRQNGMDGTNGGKFDENHHGEGDDEGGVGGGGHGGHGDEV